jgi:hypothetical protein
VSEQPKKSGASWLVVMYLMFVFFAIGYSAAQDDARKHNTCQKP